MKEPTLGKHLHWNSCPIHKKEGKCSVALLCAQQYTATQSDFG